MDTIKDNLLKEKKDSFIGDISLLISGLLIIAVYSLFVLFGLIDSHSKTNFVYYVLSYPIVWLIMVFFIKKYHFFQKAINNISVEDPIFEIGDTVVYSNGFVFEESMCEKFKVLKVNNKNIILLQSEKDSSYKETNYYQAKSNYKKV